MSLGPPPSPGGAAGRGREMVKDAIGREGLSAGAIARELATTPAAVKKALAALKVEADFVKIQVAANVELRVQKSAVGATLPKGTLKSLDESK